MFTKKSPLVGLITIWYKSASEIERFAQNLEAIDYPNIQPVFIINSLTPTELTRLKIRIPDAIIIEPRGNCGTALGWNLGIEYLFQREENVPTYIGMWNVDVTLEPGCVAQMITVMEADTSIGAVSPILFYSDERDKVQMYGGTFNPHTGFSQHDFNGETNVMSLPSLYEPDYLDGGTMLIRAEVLREVGTFDPTLFMYVEDCDMSLRIRKAGFRIVAIREARAWHYHRENKGRFPPPYELFYITRNRFLVIHKHASFSDWGKLVFKSFGTLPLNLFYLLRHRRLRLAQAYLSGIFCGITHKRGKRGWVS